MSNSAKQDKYRRLLFKKLSIKRVQDQVLLQDILLHNNQNVLQPDSENKGSYKDKQLFRFPVKKASRVRIKNRCMKTGRAKGVFRFCKLSRIRFREMASQTLLNGINKASW